jgi:hypothetical protein
MSDDLVKRLRDEDPECGLRHSIAMEAADRIEELMKDNERYRRGLIEIVQMERVPMGDERPDYVTKTGTFANDLRNRNWPNWMVKKEDKNV